MSKSLTDNYRFGIIVKRNNRYHQAVGVCSCGVHTLINGYYDNKIQCEGCKNDYFVDRKHCNNSGRFVIPYLEYSRRDNRGFKIKRTNLSIRYDEGFLITLKENLKREMEYDIVDKTLKVWRNDEVEYDYDADNVRYNRLDDTNRLFFTGLDDSAFIQYISTEVTEGLYKVVNSLSHVSYNKKNNIMRGLIRLMADEHSWLQILANAGVPNVNRFFRGNHYRSGTADTLVDTTKTKPHEILKVPRFMMSYIREDISIDRRVLQELQGHFKHLDNNKFQDIMAIVKDESNIKELSNTIERLMQIHVDYDYTNIKKLVLYLFRECRLTQGIESPTNACTYLRDYIRMSRSMGLDYEKYPKSLKKEHDVVQMNYKLINDGKEQHKLFKLSVDKKSYKNLVYEKKKSKYAIVSPQSSEDLMKEGNQLSHCVASYSKDIISDKCKILFLRDVEEIDKPLATIEVRGFNIRQARGFANRPVREEEKEFIKEWAEEKGLIEAYY